MRPDDYFDPVDWLDDWICTPFLDTDTDMDMGEWHQEKGIGCLGGKNKLRYEIVYFFFFFFNHSYTKKTANSFLGRF